MIEDRARQIAATMPDEFPFEYALFLATQEHIEQQLKDSH